MHCTRTTTGNALSQCKLHLKKLALVSDLSPDHLFENGVIKIQNRHWEDLTPEEMEACSVLLKERPEQVTEAVENKTASQSSVNVSDHNTHIKLQGLQGGDRTKPCHDLLFLCASAADIECLWSNALCVFAQCGHKMCPRLLDALLFLKGNRRFWDNAMAMDAMET